MELEIVPEPPPVPVPPEKYINPITGSCGIARETVHAPPVQNKPKKYVPLTKRYRDDIPLQSMRDDKK